MPSHAQATVDPELRLADLEKAFWACDHAATTGLIDFGNAITCSGFTVALQQRKFKGDFQAMLAWWRQHKETEHLAIAKTSRPSAQRMPRAPQ